MKTIRAFFAVSLPESLQSPLKKTQALLRSKQRPMRAIYWTNLQNLHVTLQFLRELQSDRLSQLIEKVESALKNTPGFQLELGNPQLFPSLKHPRVIALQAGPHEDLANIAKKIGLAISAIHYPLARDEFRGHLTLGRIHRNTQFNDLEPIELPPIPRVKISEICLFESKTGYKKQIYIPLAYFKLVS
ncbi:RNA ligase/cyclic nucleotide phosphodiesterase [Legionella nautarum]|uniref:RNA 2',3'-cyclic phosphodiesterase n=1 Tax=Legionella nautarum TaxID=45070 RepID=A0A0W0WS24_9GAMM|nr:RNA 2',3'-cyclic phosphodiesterase [Legionella nautarum]KTD35116.1 RNA ligase/cyclic nucleotide phosphodiesterase [Legionella nautarum]